MYHWTEDAGLESIWITGWISDSVAIGRADFDQADYVPGTVSYFHGIPAVIDFEAGTVSPIQEFLPQLPGKAGGPVPRALSVGPFGRIDADGDCLNVRLGPDTSTDVLGCYADGVFLPFRTTTDFVPEGWFAVTTPDGRAGFAASEFVDLIYSPED